MDYILKLLINHKIVQVEFLQIVLYKGGFGDVVKLIKI